MVILWKILEPADELTVCRAWNELTSESVAEPQLLIEDLTGYAVQPEGVDLINVSRQWRVLFVEDRYQSDDYGTRNAIHWPLSILGVIN